MTRSVCTLVAFSMFAFGCEPKDVDDTGDTQSASGEDEADGAETGGTETDGEEAGGEETGGEETSGEETGGEETGGEETGGEETGGEETGGEETGGEETGEGTGGMTDAGASGGDPAPVWGGTLEGELSYRSEQIDPETGAVTTSCDWESKLNSRPFVGECDGCAFAFKIDTEMTADRSASDCDPVTEISLMDSMPPLINTALSYRLEWTEGGVTGTNVLLSGMSVDFDALEDLLGGHSSGGVAEEGGVVGDPEPGKSFEDEYTVPYEGYYGGGMVTSFTEWYPIAFDIDSLPPGMLTEEDVTGTVTFDAATGALNWTSTVTTFESTDRYIDYSCSWDDGVMVPVAEDETDAVSDDDFSSSYEIEVSVDGPATDHTEDGSLTCKVDAYGDDEWDVEISSDEEEDAEGSGVSDDSPTTDIDSEEWWYSPGMDVWTVNLEAAVSTLITIDTLNVDTSFDPWFYITDADECIVEEGFDNFDCTENALRENACPGVEFIPESSGTHYILVHSGECIGDTAAYQIGIDGPAEPALTLLADDTDISVETEYQHTVTGTATVEGDYGPPTADE